MTPTNSDAAVAEAAPSLSARSSGRWSPRPAWRDRVVETALLGAALFSGGVVLVVIVFVLYSAWPLFARDALTFFTGTGWDIDLQNAWGDESYWSIGALPLMVGTLLTTVLSVAITTVLGVGAAVFLAETGPVWLRQHVETFVRLLAGIPSVVFGLIGLTVVVPFIWEHLIGESLSQKMAAAVPLDGQSLFAAVIVLTFMILPFFVTVATDSLRALPAAYRDGGLALGMSHWRVVTKILLPTAAPGMVAGVVLATARAVGEAIAMSMVAGSLAFMPRVADGPVALLQPVRTMAAAIVENGEGMEVASLHAVAFALAAVLLGISLVLSIAARISFSWFRRRVSVAGEG